MEGRLKAASTDGPYLRLRTRSVVSMSSPIACATSTHRTNLKLVLSRSSRRGGVGATCYTSPPVSS